MRQQHGFRDGTGTWLLFLAALAGCASTRGAQNDWQAKIPPGCQVDQVHFTRRGGPRLLVLHVGGLPPETAAPLAQSVRTALLGSIAEKRQSRLWRKALPRALQAAELDCAAKSHDQAFWVGRLSGADAVLWGTLRERTGGEKLASVAPEAPTATAPGPDTIVYHLTPVSPAASKSSLGRLVDFPPVPWLTRLAANEGEAAAPLMKTGGLVGPGPFDPGDQPVQCYVGNAVHKVIGEFYQAAHRLDRVFLNHTPISGILDITRLPRPRGLPKAVLAARPDILNLDQRQLYEIKPLGQFEEAAAAALLYQKYLKRAGLTVSLGPPSEPGTQGILPAPKGYVVFMGTVPGVILYYCRDGQTQYAPETVTVPRIPAGTGVSAKPEPITRTQPHASPAPLPAEHWWQRSDLVASLEAATGLTGTALITYLVVSEGLRFVLPVRNLVWTLP